MEEDAASWQFVETGGQVVENTITHERYLR
jgi:hypothetical protein